MLGYVLRRLAWTLPTLVGITLVIFLALRAAPGDPATVMAGAQTPGELVQGADFHASVELFRKRHLLDQPLARQFLHFLGPFDLSERANGHQAEWQRSLKREFFEFCYVRFISSSTQGSNSPPTELFSLVL